MPGVFDVTATPSVAEPLTAIAPRLQVSVPDETGEHDPWLGVAWSKVVPAGSVSVTVVFVEPVGPAFPTVRVYVAGEPVAADGLDEVIERSAIGGPLALNEPLAVLFGRLGSVVFVVARDGRRVGEGA